MWVQGTNIRFGPDTPRERALLKRTCLGPL